MQTNLAHSQNADGLSKDHLENLRSFIENTYAFSGSTVQACKEYCNENNLDYARHMKQIEDLRFEVLTQFDELGDI